ncbi:PKD domain-containing protein [Runella sp. SP2]|uniref:PKD domain-containing protein n=1 Tax=Runella sp. SP2 TaxID=2268026 RepID=UPI000F083CAF|nr:PKD domain-containing protein [Runella sp. SP2]AYQ36572.1 hypothetical protein DTQ70_30080 [Runella sp. SP2]
MKKIACILAIVLAGIAKIYAQVPKEAVNAAALKGVFCIDAGTKTSRAGIRIKVPAWTEHIVKFRIEWGNRTENLTVDLPKSSRDTSIVRENDFDLADCMVYKRHEVSVWVSFHPSTKLADYPAPANIFFSNTPTAIITAPAPCVDKLAKFQIKLCPEEGTTTQINYGNGQTESKTNHDYSTTYTSTGSFQGTLSLKNGCVTEAINIPFTINVIDGAVAALADSGSRAISKDTALVCLTNGKAIVRLDASGSKGSVYYYTLSNGIRWVGGTPNTQNATPRIEFSSPGIYTVTLEVENSCKVRSQKVTLVYKVSAAPTLNLPMFPDLCQRTLFKITNPVAGVKYFLNDSLEITAAGVWLDFSDKPYKITASANNECTGNVPVKLERQFWIRGIEKMKITFPRDTTLCVGSPRFALVANTTGGRWLINNQLFQGTSFDPKQKGEFWVKYQQGTPPCAAADSIKITVIGTELRVIDQTVCEQAPSVVLKADLSGGVWSCNGCQIKEDTLFLQGLTASQVMVNYTVRGSMGCPGTATGTVTIGRPRINRLLVKGACVGQAPDVQAEIIGTNQVRWYVNGALASTDLKPRLMLPAGTSNVKLEAGALDCFVSQSVQVEMASPVAPFKILASTTRGCGPLEAVLTVNQPARADVSYRWEKEGQVIATTHQLPPQRLTNSTLQDQKVVYRLIQTSSSGCGNPQTESIEVTVLARPFVQIGIDSTAGRCSPAQFLVTDVSPIKVQRRLLYVNGQLTTFESNEKWLSLPALGDSLTIYTIKLVGINECDTVSDELKLKVYPTRLRMALWMSATEVCVGSSLQLQNTTPGSAEAEVTFLFSDNTRYNGQRVAKTFDKIGTYTVRMIVKLNCVTDTTRPRTVVVVSPPKPSVQLATSTVCPNEPIRLRVSGSGAFVVEPEGLSKDSTNANPIFRFATSGTKTIRVRVYGANRNCYADTLIRVTVRPAPKARGLMLPEAICPSQIVQLQMDMERAATEYEWRISAPQQPVIILKGPQPTVNFTNSGLYDIQVKFSDGTCQDSLQSFNALRVANCQLGFPQVFTPNSDGLSDKWVPFGGEGIKKITYRILDLNGSTIFFEEDVAPNDLTRGWNGMNGQQQPAGEGTYVYQADVYFIGSNKPKREQGTIRLIRDKTN